MSIPQNPEDRLDALAAVLRHSPEETPSTVWRGVIVPGDTPVEVTTYREFLRAEHTAAGAVEFWYVHRPDAPRYLATIVGTGHPIPHGYQVVLTTGRQRDLVWHLAVQRQDPDDRADRSSA